MRNTILCGDAIEQLRTLPDESVHCVVTSPPYWGLRDYGTATWEGGDEACDHLETNDTRDPATTKQTQNAGTSKLGFRDICRKCGARRVDNQLGLEATPEEYVCNMVAVFREIRRVLRDDGTVWLNLGDSYAGSTMTGGTNSIETGKREGRMFDKPKQIAGLKPKDLVGIPWRVAFALQADGWWLRSDIIWAKPNPMPESVTDRPTKSHEYIFLLSKSERYYYDADAIREPSTSPEQEAHNQRYAKPYAAYDERAGDTGQPGNVNNVGIHARPGQGGRNKRTVWEVATHPYPEAHFATYPEALIRPCIQAGTSEWGCCEECGAPWERVTEKSESPHDADTESLYEKGSNASRISLARQAARARGGEYVNETRTTGWRPTCKHEAPIQSAIVLDPFFGSGTTGLVAAKAGRDWVGIELNPEYVSMAEKRLLSVKARLL